MLTPDDMGRDEGTDLGPEPGKGAVVHDQSGEEDFDGLPGDVLPPKKEKQERKNDRQSRPGESMNSHD